MTVCRISRRGLGGVHVPVGHRPARLVAVGPALVGLGVAVEVGRLAAARQHHDRARASSRRASALGAARRASVLTSQNRRTSAGVSSTRKRPALAEPGAGGAGRVVERAVDDGGVDRVGRHSCGPSGGGVRRPGTPCRWETLCPTTSSAMWADLAPVGRSARPAATSASRSPRAERELAGVVRRAGRPRAGCGSRPTRSATRWPGGTPGDAAGGADRQPPRLGPRRRRVRRPARRRVGPGRRRPAARARASSRRGRSGVAVFVEEEGSRFGLACLGSRLATGAVAWERRPRAARPRRRRARRRGRGRRRRTAGSTASAPSSSCTSSRAATSSTAARRSGWPARSGRTGATASTSPARPTTPARRGWRTAPTRC